MIGKRIKELRVKKGLTQRELSVILEISAGAVGMYEQNRREPPYELLQKLAVLFNVTSDYLLFGEYNTVLSASNGLVEKYNDIEVIIDNLKRDLSSQKGLMFKGKILNDSDVEKLVSAIEIGAEIALKAKEGK